MQKFYLKQTLRLFSLCPAIFVLLSQSRANAQNYCTPTVTQTGFYLSSVTFNVIGPGSTWSSGNSGYSANTSTSSKSVPRFYAQSSSFWYAVMNTSANPVTVYVQWFADWNHDGDFTDPNETGYPGSVTVPANSNTSTGINMPPTLDALTGATRIRIIASLNSNITDPCAAVTGEVEDYTVTVVSSTAPVVSTSASVFLNPQLTTQTAPDGITVNQVATGSMPAAAVITDPDDSTSFYVPRGLAITGTTGNGTWQYKIGSLGTWSNISGVTSTNALLLLGDCADTRYQPGTRLRYIPIGPETSSLTFHAWDGTTGTNGGFASTTVNGGTTAFSTASTTVSMAVTVGAPTRHFYLASATADNILSSLFDPAGVQAYTPSAIVSSNTNLTNITDMDFDGINNRLIWTESAIADKIVSANLDGSNVTVLYAFPNTASIPNGVAVGGGRIIIQITH
jgi:hypothetical protein